jgi:predicted MFS family arabinose efflux permease
LTQKQLQPWQVIIGGMCGLVLTIGLARFAYTPLLPSLQTQTGLNDANAGVLAAINYAGYMSGAIAVAWIDDVRWRYWLYSMGLWMALITTALMAVAPSFGIWAVSRYVGGLCGAAGRLMG